MNVGISDSHIAGLKLLLNPSDSKKYNLALMDKKIRKKFQKGLAHNIEMHPDFTVKLGKGERDERSIFAKLKALGAPNLCYVVSSDPDEFDDTFQELEKMISEMYEHFSHGTIFSCVPGQLAMFRTAWPHQHLIVHRPK